MRIEAAEPRFRNGGIYFARSFREQNRKWKPMFDEMTEWPYSTHDDIPDAISDLDKKDKDDKFYAPAPPAGARRLGPGGVMDRHIAIAIARQGEDQARIGSKRAGQQWRQDGFQRG